MIGKTTVGRSFKGCINYNLSKVENGKGEILECNGVREERQAMIRDFNARRMANLKLTKNVWHTSLSFQDKLENDQMLAIGKEWMKKMGLDKTQYVIVRHTDTEHPHIHIIASRIDDNARTISDNNNWKRSEAICNTLIKEYGLTPVPTERNEERIDLEKLNGKDLLKSELNRAMDRIFHTCKSMDDFERKMNELGFNCIVRYNPDKSIRGISFERDGVKIKASDVHRNLSGRSIALAIERNNERLKEAQVPGTTSYVGRAVASVAKKLFDNEEDDEVKRKRKRDRSTEL